MKLNFKLKITKIDILTIVLLSIIFFSIATWNLGSTKTPTTTALLTAGQSFYLDLGSSNEVKAIVILLKQGEFNVSVSTGALGDWRDAATNQVFPYDTTNKKFSEDYYKWYEISIGQTTRYLNVTFGKAGYQTLLAEVGVIGQNNEQIPIQSVNNFGSESIDNLQNLIDEQDSYQYPFDYMENTYFDELYFVRTSEQYLNSQLPYEWTHPPLGKLIQAAGIVVFGFTQFGWRIMGVIFATIMIAVFYFLGKELLGTWIGGFTAAFLLTFDFMHFTMARLGTTDTYVIFFTLLSQLFFFVYLRNVVRDGWKTSVVPLFLAILFFSLGFSTKWLVLYGFIGQLAILALLRLNDVRNLKGSLSAKVYGFLEHPYSVIVAFLLMAVAIYFLSYIPDMLAGRSFIDVISLQGSMYSYHSNVGDHPWASPWYSWPIMGDPLDAATYVPYWFQVAYLPDGLKSTITLLGNPAVWWVGFGAMIGLTVVYVPKIIKKRSFQIKENLPALFLIAFFFIQWLPYAFISRALFIYHFYVNVPFLCLATAFFISKYWSNKYVKLLTVIYFALVAGLFVLFYPVISGMPTSPSTIDSLRWLKGWVF